MGLIVVVVVELIAVPASGSLKAIEPSVRGDATIGGGVGIEDYGGIVSGNSREPDEGVEEELGDDLAHKQ